MRIIFSKLLTLYLGLTLSLGVNSDTECQELLNWIYKDLKVQNLELSYDRLLNKVVLGFLHVTNNLKGENVWNSELSKIKNTLISIEPKFKKIIDDLDSNYVLDLIPSHFRSRDLNKKSLFGVVSAWKRLQDNSPDLFVGLDKKYQIDNWDTLTAKVLTESINFGSGKEKYKDVIERLGKSLNESKMTILKGRKPNLYQLKRNINFSRDEISKHFRRNFVAGMSEFSTLCTEEEIEKLVLEDNYVCLRDKKPSSFDFLDRIGLILSSTDSNDNPYFSFTKKPSLANLNDDPIINIHKPYYDTNRENKNSTYCIRDPKLATMIVLHHAAFNNSPESVNELHLNRGLPDDPWLMVGYNYLVEADTPFWRPGYNQGEQTRVYSGRPLNIQGAHAGGFTTPLNDEEKEFYKDKYVFCGNHHQGFKKEKVLDKLNDEGGVSGNLASFGVTVLDDFSNSDSMIQVAGVYIPRILSSLDMVQRRTLPSRKDGIKKVITKTAELVCEIQKKYPNIKKIVPHRYFKDGKNGRTYTECPGVLIDHLADIVSEAKNLGCEFKAEESREDG